MLIVEPTLERWLDASAESFVQLASDLDLGAVRRSDVMEPPEVPGAFISLTAAHDTFLVGIAAHERSAQWLAGRMVGEDVGEDLVSDVVCELVNVLAGVLKGLLQRGGECIELELGLPMYVRGRVSGPAIVSSLSTQIELDHGSCWVVVMKTQQPPETREYRRLEGELTARERHLARANDELRQEADRLRQAKEQISHLANYDYLTGLANRRFIESLLPRLLREPQQVERKLAVLSIDLDRFKRINDTLGHEGGDEVLRTIAARLVETLRGTDVVARQAVSTSTATRVARMDGDQFLVLLPELRRAEDAAVVAQRVVDRLSEPLLLQEQELFVTASIGLALYPDNGDDAGTLISRSDEAMYFAKESGRNAFKFWAHELSEKGQRRIWIERQLRRAIEARELVNHYQPRIDLRTNRVVGAEAVARWWVDGDYMSPGEFVPVAEDTGLVGPLGDMLLLQACMDAKRWAEAGLDLVVSVNVAPAQLTGNFVDMVSAALEQSQVRPELLELEITERTLMQRTNTSRDVLLDLKAKGVRVTIDDFGTGYSSLSYLARFPIDVVKIDRSFVSQAVEHKTSATITAAIIALSHSLGATVVGEGVETEEQLAFLKRQSCEEVQGFLFSRPLPFDELTAWVTSFHPT